MTIIEHDQLLGIEVRHLAALAAIARTGSFSQAAKELGYAQSAVSQQIATLERVVGQRLVERPGGPRPVTMTEAGALVLRHAERVTARLGAIRADLDALAAGEIGALRVGVFQSASARLLPSTLAGFKASWPRIDVQLVNDLDCSGLDALVRSGQLDLAFSDVTLPSDPLVAQELAEDPYVVLVPPDSPLAAHEEIDLAALDGADLVSGSLADACSVRVMRALADARVQTRVVFRTDDNLTVQRLVGVGLGCAIVPRLAVEAASTEHPPTVVRIAPESAIIRRIGIVWHRDRYRSRAAEAFVEVAQRVAALVAV